MSKRIKPAIGEIYHIYNRGVEKRDIFSNDQDRLRFTQSLVIFNDQSPTFNNYRLPKNNTLFEVGLPTEREKMVEIMAFALMPNHYHLMVRGITENGVTEFMRKLGTGYTNYFNTKYERVGPLFQGRFKAALVKNERHFLYLPYYIHLNPLDLIDKKWRTQDISGIIKIKKFLESYKWSSHLDYAEEQNFPEIIDKEFLSAIFESPAQYKKDLLNWVSENNLEEIADIALEPTLEA
ncbi:MAG: transposase [bacterium]|nr:transposase [bacterium]